VSLCFPTVRYLTTDFPSRQVECERIQPRRPNALEAFVVYETVYLFEDWLQAFREIEIEFELLLLGMDFEDPENIAVASDCQSSCRMSGRSVSPSADRVARYHNPRRFYR
jgi:hypothetical protein